MITLTNNQAAEIVKMHNDIANKNHQADDGMAAIVLATNDNFDYEILRDGTSSIELRGFETKSGNPVTFDVDLDMVTVELDTIADFVRESVEAGEDMDDMAANFAAVWDKVQPLV